MRQPFRAKRWWFKHLLSHEKAAELTAAFFFASWHPPSKEKFVGFFWAIAFETHTLAMNDMDATQRSKPSSLEPSSKAWVFLVGTSDHPSGGDLAWQPQHRKPWKDQRPNPQDDLYKPLETMGTSHHPVCIRS